MLKCGHIKENTAIFLRYTRKVELSTFILRIGPITNNQ